MLVAALIGWATGVALAGWLGVVSPLWGLTCAAMMLVARPGVPAGALRLCLVCAFVGPAAVWADHRTPRPTESDVCHLAPRRFLRLEAVIAEPPVPADTGWRSRVEVLRAPGAADGCLIASWPARERPRVGDRWTFAGRLSRPRGPQNPGEPDAAARLARQGIFATYRAEEAHPLGPAPGWAWARALDGLRTRLLAGLGAGLSPADAALLGSLILGAGAAPVAPATADAFRLLGLSHLLAASGAQVALLAGLCLALGRCIGASPAVVAVATLPVLGLYLLLTGAPPSMVRATSMAAIALLGHASGRQTVPFATLYASALAMLVYRPDFLWDLGFQFSMLATYALCRLAAALATHPPPGPAWLAGAIAVPVTAWIWVSPWQLYIFGQGHALALLANWLAAPLVLVLTPWGLAVAAVGSASPPAAALANTVSAALLALLKGLVGWLAAQTWGAFTVPQPSPWVIAACYAALVAGFRHVRWAMLSLAAALALCVRPSPAPCLELAFLSVGQGDACVIHTPDDRWIVVDAGPRWDDQDAGLRVVLPYLRRHGCRRIDLMLASHAHLDHIGGEPALAEALPVARAWDAGQADKSRPYHDLLAGWLGASIPWAIGHRGLQWRAGGVTMEDLSEAAPYAETNDGSLVTRLSFGRFSALFTGDVEAEGERRLLTSGVDLHADLLKVAHHGSVTSTTPAFLAAVRPRLAVISVGEGNRFGHPGAAVVARLGRAVRLVRRTDRDGAVLVRVSLGSAEVTDRASQWGTWAPI